MSEQPVSQAVLTAIELAVEKGITRATDRMEIRTRESIAPIAERVEEHHNILHGGGPGDGLKSRCMQLAGSVEQHGERITKIEDGGRWILRGVLATVGGVLVTMGWMVWSSYSQNAHDDRQQQGQRP